VEGCGGPQRDNWYEKKATYKKKYKLDAHLGEESLDQFERFTSLANDLKDKFGGYNVDSIVREIESLLAVSVSMLNSSNMVGVMSSVFQYLQSHLSGSVILSVFDHLSESFGCRIEPHLGQTSPQSDQWLDLLRDIKTNWKIAITNGFFRRFSSLLGILVSVGLCKASAVTFKIDTFTVWEPRLLDRHTNCVDIVDAIVETASTFCESIYLCFRDKSFLPLFTGESAMRTLDEKFNKVEEWWALERCGNLRSIEGREPHELDHLMRDTELSFQKILQTLKPNTFEHNMINRKFQRLVAIRGEFVLHQISSGIRPAPFAIEFYGKSSQGKTTCCDQVVDALLASAGLDSSKNRRATVNAGDKFMSNWTSDKLVMIVDDVGNTKADFVEQSPLRLLIDVANNQMAYAAKADLSDKGKVFISPEILAVTTNAKNLNAYQYSVNPYSVQRRFICITVEVHPLFQDENGTLDPYKVKEYQLREKPQFDDIWQLTIETAVKPCEENRVAEYKPVTWRDQDLVKVPFAVALNYLIETFHKHRSVQQHLVETARARRQELIKCPHEGCCQLAGYCMEHHKLDAHFGQLTHIPSAVSFLGTSLMSDMQMLYTDFDSLSGNLLRSYGRKLMKKHSIYCLVPRDWLTNPRVRQLLMLIDSKSVKRIAYRYLCVTVLIGVLACYFLYMSYANDQSVWFYFALLCILALYLRVSAFRLSVRESFIEQTYRRNEISPMLDEYRDKLVKGAIAVSVSYGAVYAIVRLLKAFKKELKPIMLQGSLAPKTIEEVNQRDAEVNPWCELVKRQLPICKKAQTSTSDDLVRLVCKNLTYVKITGDDGKQYFANSLFVKSNVVLIPKHYFDRVGMSLKCEFRKKLPKQNGGKFYAEIDFAQSYHIPNTDVVMCYVSSGGSYKDLTGYFPLDRVRSVPFQWVWRNEDGDVEQSCGVTSPQRVKTTDFYYEGGTYNITIPTKFGHCGAILVSQTRGNCIVGMHLGGVTGTTRGAYGLILHKHILEGLSFLDKCEGNIITASAESFPNEILGVSTFDEQGSIPRSSAVHYMPQDSQIELYGTCGQASTFKSDAQKLPISEIVEEVCGVPNIYRGPVEKPAWFGWQTCLANMANPALPFPQALLVKAVVDYKKPLLDIVRSSLWRDARPLTNQENICGIPGKRFVDAIKMDTSIGFPLSGKKRNFLSLDKVGDDGFVEREFSDEIMQEIDRCEKCYKQGVRAYPIAKACKKDEILAKEKCRIFYGNAISLTYLIRKYYLPILRILQMNPLVSECAVGINCHGPEWEEMHMHVLKYGKERIVGGDYGSYDQKIPSQLLIASLRILIDLAAECDYTDEDLRVMRAMVGDIVYSVIAYDGVLIGLTRGSHISGNSLTVVLNGIVGSLGMRCYYYNGRENPPPFRERINVITYGDDNIGSVHPDEHNFTIKNLSEFLGQYGQIYTMPDKGSKLTDFLPFEEFEFLKRKSVHHPKLGVHLGALVDKSIFKSLHMHLYPQGHPLTENECCAMNIDGSLREWFSHGEDVYEKRRKEMIQVARKAGIHHMCTMLDCTYDDMVGKWRKSYSGAEQP